MKLHSLPVILIAITAIGCSGGSTGTGAEYKTSTDLKPETPIPATANLKIGEINMPVEIKQKSEGKTVTIDMEAHGQIFETESYVVGDSSFDLDEAAGEHYEPNLPLLKFPMKVGDTWNWKGTMTAGEKPHEASAVVTTTNDSVLLPGSGTTETVLVVIDLSIESGGPTPASRKLRFWFAKDKGVIKRQFGVGSSREPAE